MKQNIMNTLIGGTEQEREERYLRDTIEDLGYNDNLIYKKLGQVNKKVNVVLDKTETVIDITEAAATVGIISICINIFFMVIILIQVL